MSKQLTLSSILAILAMGSFALVATAHGNASGEQSAVHAIAVAAQTEL